MYWIYDNSGYNIYVSNINSENYDISEHTKQTFIALVDVIIPRTPVLAKIYGRIQYYGAKDSGIDEYLIMLFNRYAIPLATPIDGLLDAVLAQLHNMNLPIPFQNNSELVLSVTGSIKRLTLMGYYSEWSGYGTTRLEPPDNRVLEFFPVSWEQVGYPGPSLGYRVLRG